jgi:hypothetical protein
VEQILSVNVSDRMWKRGRCDGRVIGRDCTHKKRTHPGLAACRMGKKSKSNIGYSQPLLQNYYNTHDTHDTNVSNDSDCVSCHKSYKNA